MNKNHFIKINISICITIKYENLYIYIFKKSKYE